jgi:hypothetical protein
MLEPRQHYPHTPANPGIPTNRFQNSQPILDKQLNAAILHIVQHLKINYQPSPDAPDTLEGITDMYECGGPIYVFDGGCDNTIYGDKEVNYAFRAWHDYHHWKLQAPLTREGEAKVVEAQITDLFALSGGQRYCALR